MIGFFFDDDDVRDVFTVFDSSHLEGAHVIHVRVVEIAPEGRRVNLGVVVPTVRQIKRLIDALLIDSVGSLCHLQGG